MTTVAKELEKRDGWIVVNLNSTRNLLDDLARRLRNSDRVVQEVTDCQDSISTIVTILRVLQKRGKKLLITIDDNMRMFASGFLVFLREGYPVFLIMTGLYENMYSIQNDPQPTFLLRPAKVPVEPLGIPSIVREYEATFDIEEEEAKRLAHATKGYAFAFQALGALYWEYRDSLSFAQILLKPGGMPDTYVYQKIREGLTGQERAFLLAMSDDAMTTSRETCTKTHIKASSIGKYRQRLLKRGLITAPEFGKVALALPRFSHVVSLYDEQF